MIGRTISHYRIIEKLGGGGMGMVYKAEDVALGRRVALKFLSEEWAKDTQSLERLKREARAAASLNHPHICTIYEVGEAEGHVFIAMEWVEGQPLSALAVQPLPAEQVLRYGLQLGEALAHAHDRGIVHRDVKSGNVIITPDGRAKLLDFGLAKHSRAEVSAEDATQSEESLTRAGVVAGTPAYMAPEQFLGETADARTDIWALGVVLYEMAAGRRPFHGRTAYELRSAILNQAPAPLPPEARTELAAVIDHCLQKDPGLRLQSAREVRAALAVCRGVIHHAQGAMNRAPTRPHWWWTAAALLLISAIASGYFILRERPVGPGGNRTLKPLTSFVGMEWGVSWSPDASLIAYAHTKAGPMNIFVMPAAGGDPLRLTSGPWDDLLPRWSPDGRHIAFVSDRGTGAGVYLVPPLGGAERKLAETDLPWLQAARGVELLGALGAVPWSPDASELLFSRRSPAGEIAIWKTNLRTGIETQLTNPTPGTVDLAATWSFDGKRVAFARNQGGKLSLWLMDSRQPGEEPQLLLSDEYMNTYPAWTADNRRLVFVSNRAGPRNLWEIDIRSRRRQQLTTGHGNDILPAVSGAGRIAYSQYGHQIDIYWGEVDWPQEEHRRLTSHTFNNFGARASPDGRRIAYHSDRTGNHELWLLDRATGAERQLTDHRANDIMGDWSPDGREIVFLSAREGPHQVWIIDLESGRVRRISEASNLVHWEPHFSGPRWSRDGKAIAFVASDGKQESLRVVDPQGKNLRSPLSGVLAFDWYRDSRRIIYTRRANDRSGLIEMHVADLETGKDALLVRSPIAEMVVSPDGLAVAYVHASSHFNMQLFIVRLARPASAADLPRAIGQPRQLTHGGGAWHVHNGGWSPDSKAIVYTRDTDFGDLYVIDVSR